MAELATIARPYAEAAFALAKQRGELDSWSGMLALLVNVYQDTQFQAAIAGPTVTGGDVENLMLTICGENIDAQARNLVQLLMRNGRLSVLAEIQTLYEHLKSDDEGVIEASIASAYPLQDEQLEQIVNILAKRFNKKISPTVGVDSELIGGIKVQVGDKVWDASVRGRLQEMATTLTK